MSYLSPTEVLAAVDQKIVELGSQGGQNLVSGIQSSKEFFLAKRLLILKKAYNNSELTDAEKQSILNCLIIVSEKFLGPALKGGYSDGIGSLINPPVEDTVFFVGDGDDISHYWGTGNDISGYI